MLGDVLGNSPKKHVDYKQFKTNNDGVASARDACKRILDHQVPNLNFESLTLGHYIES